MTSNTQIATTILEQLGGRRFVMMTGAKNLIAHPNALSFKLPGGGGFAKDGINYVKITLDPSDTYTVEFSRVRGRTVKTLHTVSDIYAENLRDVFTRATGLQTSLGTMGRAS
jgi:hypothetical protein